MHLGRPADQIPDDRPGAFAEGLLSGRLEEPEPNVGEEHAPAGASDAVAEMERHGRRIRPWSGDLYPQNDTVPDPVRHALMGRKPDWERVSVQNPDTAFTPH